MSPKILVVGCGITGAAVNRYITSMFPALAPSYTFWEKSSSLGGRMITNFQKSAADPAKSTYLAPHCDMGAQYLTRSSDDAETLIYSLLSDAGIITPIVDNTVISGMRPEHLIKTHYVAPLGLSSVIDHLSKGSDSHIRSKFCYDTELESITLKYSDERKASVFSAVGKTSDKKIEESFDTIILTLPAPQLLALEGDIVEMLGTEFRGQLDAIRYSSRYAVAFYFPLTSWSALQAVPWSGKYVFDDDIIRYISIENRKTNFTPLDTKIEVDVSITGEKNDEVGPSILVHTSVPFGIEHKDTDEKVVYEMILKHLNMVLPNLGLPVSHYMVNWRESQISKGLNTVGFSGEMKILKMLSEDGPMSESGKRKLGDDSSTGISGVVIVAGDAFTESNFEGCLRSAKAAAVAIGNHYEGK